MYQFISVFEKCFFILTFFFFFLQSFKLPAPPSGYELRHDGRSPPDPKAAKASAAGTTATAATAATASYYVNIFTGVRWFAAEDEDSGKVYFYEENGNESCWSLPNVGQSIQDREVNDVKGQGQTEPAKSRGHHEVTPAPRFKKPLTGSTKRIAAAQLRPTNNSSSSSSEEALNRLEAANAAAAARFPPSSTSREPLPELRPRPPPLMRTKTEMLEQRKFSNNSAHVLHAGKAASSPNFQIGSVGIVVVKQVFTSASSHQSVES